MIENIENLILEHLRVIHSDIAALAGKVDALTLRVSSLEEHVAGLHRDLALIHGDIANINQAWTRAAPGAHREAARADRLT